MDWPVKMGKVSTGGNQQVGITLLGRSTESADMQSYTGNIMPVNQGALILKVDKQRTVIIDAGGYIV